MKNKDKTLENKIRNRRLELNLTQAKLAEKAGLTAAAISQFESGLRKPSFDALHKLAHALEVNTNYLLDNEQQINIEYYDDPKIKEMVLGIKNLPEKDRQLLFDIYQLLIKRNNQ
ncbi:MAG: helix-turn-helix domain-containing protein [bacterium]